MGKPKFKLNPALGVKEYQLGSTIITEGQVLCGEAWRRFVPAVLIEVQDAPPPCALPPPIQIALPEQKAEGEKKEEEPEPQAPAPKPVEKQVSRPVERVKGKDKRR